MRPYKFKPFLKETIWGGDQLAAFKGVETAMTQIGESWELSGVKGHESVVVPNGVDEDDVGLTLPALIEKYGSALVGEAVYARFGVEFPLLVKFIDAKQDLSVQVHPDDALAARRHGCRGKTEMWYILKTAPGAKIYAGLRKTLTPEDYARLVTSEAQPNPIQDALATYESHPGDLYFLPAGRLHAIGAGNLLAEIQETSDITYRVYDFGRRDANGNTRELHTDLAKDAIDYTVLPDYRASYDATKAEADLVRCEHFTVKRLAVDGETSLPSPGDTFVIVVCLDGAATVNGVAVRRGETLLVPAADNALSFVGTATFLTATV